MWYGMVLMLGDSSLIYDRYLCNIPRLGTSLLKVIFTSQGRREHG